MAKDIEVGQVARLIEQDAKDAESGNASSVSKFQREVWTINRLAHEGNPGYAKAIYSELDDHTRESMKLTKGDRGEDYLTITNAFATGEELHVLRPERFEHPELNRKVDKAAEQALKLLHSEMMKSKSWNNLDEKEGSVAMGLVDGAVQRSRTGLEVSCSDLEKLSPDQQKRVIAAINEMFKPMDVNVSYNDFRQELTIVALDMDRIDEYAVTITSLEQEAERTKSGLSQPEREMLRIAFEKQDLDDVSNQIVTQTNRTRK